ncbi:MAG: SphA family protein [Rhizomicrobium sp.]
MARFRFTGRARGIAAGSIVVLGIFISMPRPVLADEFGVSFWVPGLFGSLAAAPQQPGFSLATINYFTDISAGRGADFQQGGAIFAGIDANADLGFFVPGYVFANPILGGQFAVSMATVVGHSDVSASATLTGPLGRVLSGTSADTITGFGDLYPQATLRWNAGVHNFMTYITGDAPVGAYAPRQLANLGIGHSAIDSGGGYTYFDPQTGHELSAVAGFTYNLMNPSSNYQNGVDFHFDWGASQFITKQVQVGLVGYAYQQLTADTGAGDLLGPFESRVFGVGPA